MDLEPDVILAIGVRHGASGNSTDFDLFRSAERIVAVGPDVEIFENIPGLDVAVMADELRTTELLDERVRSEQEPERYSERREWAQSNASRIRELRRTNLQSASEVPGKVRPLALLDAVDTGLEKLGGGLITTEQFAVPLECVNEKAGGGSVDYIRPAGGSEGFGMGAPLGAKLAAPDKPVIGLVGRRFRVLLRLCALDGSASPDSCLVRHCEQWCLRDRRRCVWWRRGHHAHNWRLRRCCP